jgi:hypothetical protein
MTDQNVIDFMERFNAKQAEKYGELSRDLAQTYLSIFLNKIKLVSCGDIDITRADVIRDACIAFDIANDEFLENDKLIDRYGEDKDTPSVQLFIVNTVLNRAIELFYGVNFKADKVDTNVSIWDKEKNQKVDFNDCELHIGADGCIYEVRAACCDGDVWLDRESTSSSKYEIRIENY